MLLSRALNRGYGAGRARWPGTRTAQPGCLWVMDEVQLMDVGLITRRSFKRSDSKMKEKTCFRPCRTWWMSATLQPAARKPGHPCMAPELPSLRIDSRPGQVPVGSQKTVAAREKVATPVMLAAAVASRHIELGSGTQGRLGGRESSRSGGGCLSKPYARIAA